MSYTLRQFLESLQDLAAKNPQALDQPIGIINAATADAIVDPLEDSIDRPVVPDSIAGLLRSNNTVYIIRTKA